MYFSPFFFWPPSSWESSFFLFPPSRLCFGPHPESVFFFDLCGWSSNFASSTFTRRCARLVNSSRVYTGFLSKSSQRELPDNTPARISIKWLLSSTPLARASSRLNCTRYFFSALLGFCLMLARDEASGFIVLAAWKCFLKSEDS